MFFWFQRYMPDQVFLRVCRIFLCCGLLWASMSGVGWSETRTLSLYHIHTKEKLTITYKKDGRYLPSAMAQLNYFFRDWRKNQATDMDPKAIDLMWELYRDLGAKQPITVVCGYRSTETNAMLLRSGRNVAKTSQHSYGRAIDLLFPGVPLERLRNMALARQEGGVGFYPPRSGMGFVHIDTGSVRHWPALPEQTLARIYREYAPKNRVFARSSLRSDPMGESSVKGLSWSGAGEASEIGAGKISHTPAVPQQPHPAALPFVSLTPPAPERKPFELSVPLPFAKVDVPQAQGLAPVEVADSPSTLPIPKPKPSLPVVLASAPGPLVSHPNSPLGLDIIPVSAPAPKPYFSENSVSGRDNHALVLSARKVAPVSNSGAKSSALSTVFALALPGQQRSSLVVNRFAKGNLE